jgi:hypothetical protein
VSGAERSVAYAHGTWQGYRQAIELVGGPLRLS